MCKRPLATMSIKFTWNWLFKRNDKVLFRRPLLILQATVNERFDISSKTQDILHSMKNLPIVEINLNLSST